MKWWYWNGPLNSIVGSKAVFDLFDSESAFSGSHP